MRRSFALNPMVPGVAGAARNEAAGGWPIVAGPVALALVLIFLRMQLGSEGILTQSALLTLALISMVSASALLVTNVAVKDRILDRVGVTAAGLGFGFMFSSWMIRWLDAGDAEGWLGGRVWRYVPLDNLYALTLGFASCAALATLVVIRSPKHRALGAMALPLVTLVLIVANLLDSEIHRLPPILSSYWLPIHVSTATIGYGVALLSFGVAMAYLVKDGMRADVIAVATALFGVFVFATIGRSGVILGGSYSVSVMAGHDPQPLRAELPYVGPLMALTLAALVGSLVAFTMEWQKSDGSWRKLAWRLYAAATVLQVAVIATLYYVVSTLSDPVSRIAQSEYAPFGKHVARQMQLNIDPSQYTQLASNWLRLYGADLFFSMKSNPIELGSLLTLLVALLMTGLFAWKREAVVASLPSAESLDTLLYRSVAVVLPLLTLVLVTGAVWANESWGRYWGWDPKEVGALVAWIAYAGYLHARITHGWTGRRSAYFAIVGFALVIFTWLGVSYLLPGLHSYA